jgi:hypothetical protein
MSVVRGIVALLLGLTIMWGVMGTAQVFDIVLK